jgi:hypothetical protein
VTARGQGTRGSQTVLNDLGSDGANVRSEMRCMCRKVAGRLTKRHGGCLVAYRPIRFAARRYRATGDDEVLDFCGSHAAQRNFERLRRH